MARSLHCIYGKCPTNQRRRLYVHITFIQYNSLSRTGSNSSQGKFHAICAHQNFCAETVTIASFQIPREQLQVTFWRKKLGCFGVNILTDTGRLDRIFANREKQAWIQDLKTYHKKIADLIPRAIVHQAVMSRRWLLVNTG